MKVLEDRSVSIAPEVYKATSPSYHILLPGCNVTSGTAKKNYFGHLLETG